MAVSASFLELARETFAPFGEIAARRMFGAAGLYCDGLFFAVLDEDEVYLKTDAETREAFERAGARPFTYEMKNGSHTSTSYFSPPESILDDADARARWTELALDAARRAARLKKRSGGRGRRA